MSRDKNAERAFLSVLRFIVPLPPVFCSKEAHRFRCASRCVMWFGSGAADIQIVSRFCSQLRPNAEIYDAVCCVQFQPRFDIPRRMDGYISGDNGDIPASCCGRVIGEANSNAAVSRKCSSFMAGSLSMAGSDSGGLDGCKVYSGVPQYGSRLSLEAFPGYCREAVGVSGMRIRTEHYGNMLILPD